MRALLRNIALTLCALFALRAPTAHGAFHLWQIKEIFSNADGSVQFIEFFTTSSGQEFLSGHNLTATSDGAAVSFTFANGIPVTFPETTANRHFLMATAGFAALQGGVTPNYTPLPSNFFNPNATSISFDFAHGWDVLNIDGSAIPKDGVTSLTDTNTVSGGPDNLVATVNSPTNFAGAVGSVNLGGGTPSAGDFDEDGTVDADDLADWHAGFGMQGAAVDHTDGDADDDNDVDGADFVIWQQDLGAGAAAAAGAVPEPAAGFLLAFASLAELLRRRRR